MRYAPEQGVVDSLYERLRKFIAQYDSNWENVIEGVSTEEIEQLKRINQIPERGIDYPSDYIMYLKYMGRNDGGLLQWGFIGEVLTDYDTIKKNDELDAACYDKSGEEEKMIFLVGVNEEIGAYYFIFYLPDQYYFISDEGMDVREISKHEIISSSVEKLLFQSAVKRYEQQLPYVRDICFKSVGGTNKELLQLLSIILQKYKMEVCWISDEANYFFWGEDGSMWINTYDWIGGVIASYDEMILQQILADIRKIKGFEVLEFESTRRLH